MEIFFVTCVALKANKRKDSEGRALTRREKRSSLWLLLIAQPVAPPGSLLGHDICWLVYAHEGRKNEHYSGVSLNRKELAMGGKDLC